MNRNDLILTALHLHLKNCSDKPSTKKVINIFTILSFKGEDNLSLSNIFDQFYQSFATHGLYFIKF